MPLLEGSLGKGFQSEKVSKNSTGFPPDSVRKHAVASKLLPTKQKKKGHHSFGVKRRKRFLHTLHNIFGDISLNFSIVKTNKKNVVA